MADSSAAPAGNALPGRACARDGYTHEFFGPALALPGYKLIVGCDRFLGIEIRWRYVRDLFT